ncbi:unnamed protein product, partial [Laminaria digitata]
FTEHASNYRLTQNLDDYLADAGVLGIAGVDTRALTRALRSGGVVQAVLTDRTDLSDAEVVEMARQVKSMSGQNLAAQAGGDESFPWTDTLGQWSSNQKQFDSAQAPTVLVFDYGIKSNIPRNLAQRGFIVTLIPQNTSAAEIKQLVQSGQAHGLFLSHGPGDPEAVEQGVVTLR